MSELELIAIAKAAVPGALEKAKHYRLLNDPEQAESICLDILEVQPDHREAKVVLILALTDRFSDRGGAQRIKKARELARSIEDPYQALYYEGIVWEREGRADLKRNLPGGAAYVALRRAMDLFKQASARSTEDDAQADLRFNGCLRTIRERGLKPPDTEPSTQLLE